MDLVKVLVASAELAEVLIEMIRRRQSRLTRLPSGRISRNKDRV